MTPFRQCKPAPVLLCWRALLVLCLCCIATPVLSVSLGEETILSVLGDPVEVEIDVLQWDDIDPELAEVSLASRAEYERFGLDWQPVLEILRFNLVGPDQQGRLKLLVSTREPVAEPYLDLLLVMRWSGGALLREYVLLFDLPPALEHASDRVVARSVPAPESPQDALDPPDVLNSAADAGSVPEQGVDAEAMAAGNQTALVTDTTADIASPPYPNRRSYVVREGDGLWGIARQFQPADIEVNLYQMLLGIHDLNPAAFINGNISLLKAGVVLQIPDASDLAVFDAAVAQERFEQLWNSGAGPSQSSLPRQPQLLPERSREIDDVAETPEPSGEMRETGTESGRAVPATSGLLLPASAPVVREAQETDVVREAAAVLEQGGQSAAVPGAAETAASTLVESQSDSSAPASIPSVDQADAVSPEMLALLETRSLQIASLEEQLSQMRQSMNDARQVTARINDALAQALARQAAENAASARNFRLLGVLAVVLLVALLVAMLMLARLIVQLRSRRTASSAEGRVGVEGGFEPALDFPVRDRSTMHRSTRVAVRAEDSGIVVEESGIAVARDEEKLRQNVAANTGQVLAQHAPEQVPEHSKA